MIFISGITPITDIHLAQTNPVASANAYGNLGIVYRTRGALDKAVVLYEKALAVNEALGSNAGMAYNYANLGSVYEARDEKPAACRAWGKSTDLFAEVGVPHMVKRVEGWMSAAACP